MNAPDLASLGAEGEGPRAAHDLSRLLRPKSIAVVGGGTWCENVINECRTFGFTGPIWPVHPTRTHVGDMPAVRDVAALPSAPDAAFVGVNRHASVEVVKALSARGSGGAVCFASGFQEAIGELSDGADVQTALLSAAGEMPILGPNCYGFINGLDQTALWPDVHGMVPVEEGVAIITQSSNIALNLTMQRRGLPIAYLLTAGNQAQIDLAAIGMAALSDPRVTALGLHIEGIGDLRRFEALANAARDAGKRIIALKVGASDQAQAATISHTASLAGSATGASALLRRLGIAEVKSLSVFLETLKVLHVAGPLQSNRIASMSCSGGEASLMADTACAHQVVFPPLTDRQTVDLRAALGPKVALANPLDYHTYIWGDRAAMAACFAAMMSTDLAMGCVVLDFPRSDRCNAAAWDLVIEAVADAQTQCGVPMAIVSSLPDTLPEAVAQDIIARGLVSLCGLDDALAAIGHAALGVGDEVPSPLLIPGPDGPTQILTESASKQALVLYGVPVPNGCTASSARAAADAAARITGPIVLKGEGLAHKSEAGAVKLNLHGPEEVRQAADAMACDSFLIEEMISDASVELLIGVVRDPAHGFVLTLGAGGTFAELLDDTTHLLLPVTPQAADAALSRLALAPRIDGYRNAPGANRKAIVNAVLAVQDYVTAHTADIFEVEINPLICTPTRAVAVDALIRLRETP